MTMLPTQPDSTGKESSSTTVAIQYVVETWKPRRNRQSVKPVNLGLKNTLSLHITLHFPEKSVTNGSSNGMVSVERNARRT